MNKINLVLKTKEYIRLMICIFLNKMLIWLICLAFMLLMLCGVSYGDARRDYDITFFTERYRHCESSHKTIHETHFNPFVEQLRAYGTGTLAENIEAFILDLGLTKEDIEAIRQLLTEEVF